MWLEITQAGLAKMAVTPQYSRMDTIPTNKAERELPELIHRASTGETIVLEAPSGERVLLAPLQVHRGDRTPGLMKDKIDVPARLFEPMSADELKLWYGEDA